MFRLAIVEWVPRVSFRLRFDGLPDGTFPITIRDIQTGP